MRVSQESHANFLKVSPSHPELPPAELVFSFAYELLRVFFLVSQFYMRKITLTTVRVTIRPGLPHLAVAPFVRLHLRNKHGERNVMLIIIIKLSH